MQFPQSVFSQFSTFGFSGSRGYVPESLRIVTAFVPSGSTVFTGCAYGVDAYVREAFPSARIFHARDYGTGVSSFVLRSVACVEATKSANGLWVSFPPFACPETLTAHATAARCFSGAGSGTWASLAFAVGSGCAALVFLPPSVPPPAWVWNRFSPVGLGAWYCPTAPQSSLF